VEFTRMFQPQRLQSSAFLFGPRMTGKTTLLRAIKADAFFDLLDPDAELRYRANPSRFWEEVSALGKKSLVVVDEVQRVPELLNYVQMGMDRLGHTFLLSGSSARKLRRGGANLLGGRALDLRLHPLTVQEMGTAFSLERALQFGTLPRIAALLAQGKRELAVEHLRSYVTTYIKEEIQAEALTRNVGAFQRFLAIAAQNNGQVIEFANVSRDCAVPASTVKEYYQILEDTLLGFFLWPYHHSERKKARPKSYLFDCGVIRAMQNRLLDPPTAQERGVLFETWFVGELVRLRDYLRKPHTFSFWRERDVEVDLLIEDGHGPRLAIELKSGRADVGAPTLRAFSERFPKVRLIVASATDQRARKVGGIEVLPWREALEVYRGL
jgi:predicted AAA+ superfamily ATPase